MADQYVQVATDGSGKKLQTHENTVNAQVVNAQTVVQVDTAGAPVVSATGFGTADTTGAPAVST